MDVREFYTAAVLQRLMRAMVWALLGFTAFGMQAQVYSSVDTTTIRIGEEIKYSIEVVADSTELVLFPEGQSFGPLEMIESYDADTTYEQAKYRLIKKYGITQYDSGSYTIPAQKIVIGDRVFSTDSLDIEVRDVPVDTTKQKMFDIKPAVDVGQKPFNFLTLLVIFVILGLAAFLFIWFRRKKKREEAEAQLPPYEAALESLQKLDEAGFLKNEKPKAYYSELTEILKRYLHEEVDVAALESTSDELIDRLQLLADADKFDFNADSLRELHEILRRADLVKFAKLQMDPVQARSDRSSIESIITDTHDAIPEPTEEELMATQAYMEAMRKKRQRRKWVIGGTVAFASCLLAGVIYGSIYGFDELKDQVLGNELRELSEGRWYKSEYGSPSIIIETPEILKRVSKGDSTITENSIFEYGDELEPLYISISSFGFVNDSTVIEMERFLDEALVALEERGARNLLVKRDNFETENGMTGLKAYGEFNVQVSDNRVLKQDSSYELIIFTQPGFAQQILIVYWDDERYAEGIKERILNSIELEIRQQNSGGSG